MVHGTGSFGGGGGGGGGGFSGSVGFSTTIFAHNHYSRSRGHGDSEECDCSWICVCLFCRGQSFKVRIFGLWVWLVAIVITSSLITLFHVNKSQTVEATVTDMRKVPMSPSKTFCKAVSLSSSRSSFTAFLVDGDPITDSQDSRTDIFTKKTAIAYNNYEYWGFYLLKNSLIEISACPDTSLDFAIVRGKEDFENFKNGECTYSCTVFRKTTYCNRHSEPEKYHYKVTQEDEHYLFFSNRFILPFPTNLEVNITLVRYLYDLNSYVSKCSNSQPFSKCTLEFPLHSHPSIVLNVTSSSDLEGDAEIEVMCVSRKWVYVMIFFILPLVLGGLGTILIIRKYRKKPEHTATSTASSSPFSTLPSIQEDRGTTESRTRTSSGYGAVTSLPKYETATENPPSYEDAMKK